MRRARGTSPLNHQVSTGAPARPRRLDFRSILRIPAHPSDVLRICIPVHNEATTIGVLLWRLRSVFQGFSREYDVVVYDDASTDGTAEVLEPYQSVMPLTVLRSTTHRGYAASIDALVRHVAADDEYARRDAMVLLQGDFTENPEHLPELVKRFEGGADLVAVERTVSSATPADERRLRRWGRWAVRPFLQLPAIADPFTGFRLVRISVLRELLKALGNRPVCEGEGWAANIDFAMNVAPFARRIENVQFAPRYDVRQRASRRRGWADVLALFHWARAARRIARPSPGGKPMADAAARSELAATVSAPPERGARAVPVARTDGESRPERGSRPSRDRDRSERDKPDQPTVTAELRPPLEERAPREARGAREERALRGEELTVRAERLPRAERAAVNAESTPPDEPIARAPRPPRKPRTERPARTDAEIGGSVAAALDAAEPVELEMLVDGAPAEIGTPDDAPAGEKRTRRRRRRSRRERGVPVEGELEGDEGALDGGDDLPVSHAIGGQSMGTSRASAGEQDEGSDDADNDASDDVGSDVSGDDAPRKRRPRRRRRGRKPGSDTAEHGDTSPPAAEPPAA